MSNIALPYTQVIDPASFKSVLNAKIYIGEYGVLPNPANSATWKQAYFVQDDGTRVAASQPIRTNAAGFAVDGSGNIRTVQVDGQYSLIVQDSFGVQKYSNTRVTDLAADLANTTDPTKGAAMVGYLPAGTGAIGRTIQDRLREKVSVKDFGALGIGTDDTAAIAAAYSYCANNNRTIYFPAGNYGTATGFVFDKAINIIGENEQVVFVPLADGITVVKFDRFDRIPNVGYIFVTKNIAVNASGRTGCIGFFSLNAIGQHWENCYSSSCDQGFRLEGDQYCQYTNIRAYNCIIGIRLVDYTGTGGGGGSNNQFNSPVAKNCQVSYLLGRTTAPQPLHTVTFINAISLGATFSSYCIYNYGGITLTNCSPESAVTGTGSAVYDGVTVKAGLGHISNSRTTIRDTVIATNGQQWTVESNSIVSFDNYSGSNCSVSCDSTSVAIYSNGLLPGNSSKLQAVHISGILPAGNRATSYSFPAGASFEAGLSNHVSDPVTIVQSLAATNPGVTAQVDWHSALGICGSIRITDGTSAKGISAAGDSTAFPVNSILLLGLNVVSSANCQIHLNIPGQVSGNFDLTAGVPQRVYIMGGGSGSSSTGYFDLKINDTSGATVYFNRAQWNINTDSGGAPKMAAILERHSYNSKLSQGDVVVLASPPTMGTFKVNDVVFNKSPTAGGTIGWVCTTAGSPGTWKTFGAISA